MENSIKIPKVLREVHGEQASVLDLLLPHSLSIIASVYLLIITDFGLIKSILLFILTYDLIGGVIANFSQGTSRFYAESATRRFKFIALHVLQPAVLWFLFADHQSAVILLSVYVVGSAIVINQINPFRNQLVVSGTLVVAGIFLLQMLVGSAPFTLQFLLTAFILKLPMAWAVRWYN